jgi:hypothetical protein
VNIRGDGGSLGALGRPNDDNDAYIAWNIDVPSDTVSEIDRKCQALWHTLRDEQNIADLADRFPFKPHLSIWQFHSCKDRDDHLAFLGGNDAMTEVLRHRTFTFGKVRLAMRDCSTKSISYMDV